MQIMKILFIFMLLLKLVSFNRNKHNFPNQHGRFSMNRCLYCYIAILLLRYQKLARVLNNWPFLSYMMKFQTLRAFYSSSIQLLLAIPSGTQCALCAIQYYPIAFESINVENHQKWSTTPSLFNKKWSWLKLNGQS